MAVANRASAMPGATTARVVSWRAAMAEKLFMMPQTVPNRPTKGDTEPMVARRPSCCSMPSVSRRMVTFIAFSMRSLMPGSMASRRPPPPFRNRAAIRAGRR